MSEVVEIEDVEVAPAVAYQTGDEVPEGIAAVAEGAGFVHLSVHSEYSLRDGLAKVGNLAQRVAELGMPAVALTDHANLFGLVKFYAACRDAGVKALIGADLHYSDAGGMAAADGVSASDGQHRCIVLVASDVGYRNLCGWSPAPTRNRPRTAREHKNPRTATAASPGKPSSPPPKACWCCSGGTAISAPRWPRVGTASSDIR